MANRLNEGEHTMTDLPGGPTWLNGKAQGDVDEATPTPAGGPFAVADPPERPAGSEPLFASADPTSAGHVPPPPMLDSPWVDPLPTVEAPSAGEVPPPPAADAPSAMVPPPAGAPAAPGGHHLFNGPPPLFAADQPYGGDSGSSARTQTVDQSVWTTPDVDGFDDLTAPQANPTPLFAPSKGKAKAKRAKAAAAAPVGESASAAPAPAKPKAKSANESNLPKLLAALGVTVLIAAIALFALGRGDDADTAADTTTDESAAASADGGEPLTEEPAATDAVAEAATDPAAEVAATPAPAAAGDEEAARALLAEVWLNAGTKRDVHAHLMTTISEMEATGDPSAVRVAAAAAANAYRSESELWNTATERISTLGDPYRTSLLMLKRANEVMLAGADELSACETCTADQALALARNGERLTSDGMADIIAILPPVVSQQETPRAG